MIAVDAPVLVELLTNGARADAAEACLRQALGSGRVVVCVSALAALCASLKNGAEALGALERRIRLEFTLEHRHECRGERAFAEHASRHVGDRERDGERDLLHADADEPALKHLTHEAQRP